MTISLTKPAIGDTNWGAAVNNNFIALENELNTTVWQGFTPVINATTTNPGKPATNKTERCQWRRDGGDMLIQYHYSHTIAGTPGSGTYKFQIPGGYQINSSLCVFGLGTSGSDIGSVVGSASGKIIGTTNGPGEVFTASATELGLWVASGTGYTYLPVSSTFYSFSNTNLSHAFCARVPIQGWGS